MRDDINHHRYYANRVRTLNHWAARTNLARTGFWFRYGTHHPQLGATAHRLQRLLREALNGLHDTTWAKT